MPKISSKTSKNQTKKPNSATKLAKKPAEVPETLPPAPVDPHDLFSISALSRNFNLDRATTRDRIEKAGIKPHSVKEKEKLYELTEQLEMVLRQDELAEAKLKKLELEGQKLEHDLAVKRGEFVSVAEVTEYVQRLVSRMYKESVINIPKEIGRHAHESKNSAQATEIIQKRYSKLYDDLRGNFKKFL